MPTINTDSLSVFDGGLITVDVGGIGNSGNIVINATESVNLESNAVNFIDGEPDNLFSTISSNVRNNSIGNSGNVEINTANLSVKHGAAISASIFGEGNAGNLTIRATDSIELSEDSNIDVDVFPGATGNSGSLLIETGKLTVSDGSQISTSTLGQGNAGSLTIRATESIVLEGTNDTGSSGFFASALIEDGNSGDLQIFTKDLEIRDRAIITVSNFPSIEGLQEPGTGEAGNLIVQANSISLENGGRIDAATQAGEGGNITLNITEDITLRDNSFISARALEDANGGNLNINSRFIIAFPSQGNGNDIIATAERGNGGNIIINARQLFNLQEGNAIDSEGNFFSNNRNDIDASSQAEGLDGTVTINNPDVDPLRGTTELPTNPVSAETIAKNTCSTTSDSEQQNTFVVKGKGGVPPLPTATLSAEPLLTQDNTTQTNVSSNNNVNQPVDPYYIPAHIKPFATDKGHIYPARGIIKTADGKIILTAYPTNGENTRIPDDPLDCS